MKTAKAHHTFEELTALSKAEKDSKLARRILAIRDVLALEYRKTICERYGLTRETLRRWVSRYDADGLDGLRDKKGAGRPRKLSPEAEASLKERLSSPPDPEKDGVSRWRAVDIQRILKEEYGAHYKDPWNVCVLCRRLGLSWISGRPSHPKKPENAADDFKKN